MRLCSAFTRFISPSVYHEKKYYFFTQIETINGVVSVQICFYKDGHWRQDTAYLKDIEFARKLFQFAIKHKLTDKMPKALELPQKQIA